MKEFSLRRYLALLVPLLICLVALIMGAAAAPSRSSFLDREYGGVGKGYEAAMTDLDSAASPVGWAKQVTAGYQHTCGLTDWGSVKCWGDNRFGQLGDGTIEQRVRPVDVIGLNARVKVIAAGGSHTCAVTELGAVACWGSNGSGQLGNAAIQQSSTPVPVVGLEDQVSFVATGGSHTCAVTQSGGVKCWGSNAAGQLGDGTEIIRLTPVDAVGLAQGILKVSASELYHSCATEAAGVDCWGDNESGQLGDGTNLRRSSPVAVADLQAAVDISSGAAHTCAVTREGAAKCWGSDPYGQLGIGSWQYPYPNTPVNVVGLQSGVSSITAGADHTCALLQNGELKCWGNGEDGRLGIGAFIPMERTPADVVGLGEAVTQVSAGSTHTCAVTISGSVKCWGGNQFGQLGEGTTISRPVPADVLMFDCQSVTDIPRSECDALTTLYDQTFSPTTPWRNNAGWLREPNPCAWFGVTCDAGHVTGLDLHGNRLSGDLPSALSDLTELKALDLSDNDLGGPLPSGFGALRRLEFLALQHNRLGLFNGSLPPEWGHLTSLRRLDLYYNYFIGPIPKEWGGMTALESLDLYNSGIGGVLPREIGNLKELQFLELGMNNLSGPLPSEISQLQALRYLGLDANAFTGSLPAELGHLTSLQVFTAYSNAFGGALPCEIGDLTMLQYLNLRGNRIEGALPNSLARLRSLQYIYLGENQFSGTIPPEFSQLSSLQVLDLSSNQLVASIPPQLGQLPLLANLYLNDNHLSGVIPPQIGDLHALQGLQAVSMTGSLPFSSRRHQPYTAFLKDYMLSEPVTGDGRASIMVSPPPAPPCCGYLHLSSNSFTGSVPEEMAKLTGLHSLDLAGNQLRGAIPPGIVGLGDYWENFGHNALAATAHPAIAATQTAPPLDLNVAAEDTGVMLSWTPIPYTQDGGYYEISYATTLAGPFIVHGFTADKSSNAYEIAPLVLNHPYYFRVRTFTPAHEFTAQDGWGRVRRYDQQNDIWSDYTPVVCAGCESIPPHSRLFLPVIR